MRVAGLARRTHMLNQSIRYSEGLSIRAPDACENLSPKRVHFLRSNLTDADPSLFGSV
jgi:hypothetical protein